MLWNMREEITLVWIYWDDFYWVVFL